jgi:hypothetical protein
MVKKQQPKKEKQKIWSCQPTCQDPGFFGRVLFIVGLLIALNMTGHLENVSIWIQILIGVGFALMRF